MQAGLLEEGLTLGRALAAHAPGRCALALLLLLTAGITEAFGIVMIVPLLHVIELTPQPGAGGPVVEAVVRAVDALGITLTLPTVLGVILGLAAVRSAVSWQRNVLLAGIRLEFIDRIRGDLYASVAAAKWEFLLSRRQSDVQHVLTSDVNRAGQGAYLILQLIVTVVLSAVQLALAFLVAPVISLAMLAVGAALLVLTRPLVRRSRDLGRQLSGSNRDLHASVTDFLGGLKLAKSHDAEGMHVRHFTDTTARMRHRQLAFTALSSAARAGLDMGVAVALATLAWVSLSTAALTVPELVIMVLIFMRVTPSLVRLQQTVQQLAHALPAYTHAQEVHQALRAAAETRAGDDEARMDLRHALSAHNVSFAHASSADRQVLAGVDLVIRANEIVAIAGPSGAGKSTLADLLLGLIEPSAGEVRIDGTPLTGTDRHRWRRSVAYVPQEPYLFHDTIRANLSWARPRSTEAEMWRALRHAAADALVRSLPRELDTVVGDRGSRLSGGERQRITLARALLREPALLVLDEVTSALDAGNERQVLATLRRRRERMTVIVVAHRTALLEGADRVVLLDSGRIVATGPWSAIAPELAGLGMDADARRGGI